MDLRTFSRLSAAVAAAAIFAGAVAWAQYRSNNLSTTMRRLQYRQKEDGRWRTNYEGAA
ncbi:MAG: hypothetical protein OEV81_11475 [Betaproteobacteria bacterium]|nr:hypothetical protein [Betaproteobacteria bacterium]MDH5222183.1 hypothetical protein [Betaproteobacteria bacterium]MDH5352698.1 hypothetical protein [Betaproteobacteria bacterium]